MANEEHLKILMQGVKVWNEWRKANPEVRPNLREAYLAGENLTGADLRDADQIGARLAGVDLCDANLEGADLSRADLARAKAKHAHLADAVLWLTDLSQANLDRADLHGASLLWSDLTCASLSSADLSKTSLCRANLSGADLSGANVTKANLSRADLTRANLTEANFSGARFADTILADLDLSTAKGLETVQHRGPSTIGIDTFFLSEGKIPEVFLRGCGVPDTFITFAASLIGKPIQFYSCFISYSSKDQDFATRLHNDLQAKGIRVWFAPEDLKIGERIHETVEQAIRIYDKLMVVLSANSMNSAWVRREVRTALEKERQQNRTVLFPLRLDDTVMDTTEDWADDIRKDRHIGDFRKWQDPESYQKAFDRLLRDLQAEPDDSRQVASER